MTEYTVVFARKLLILLLLLPSLSVFAKGKGGKTKINIHPNQTEEGTWTFSTEADQYIDTTYLNTALAYSSTNGWDVAVSSQNIPVWGGGEQNYQDDTYLQVAKTIRWNEKLATIFATQNGYALFSVTPAAPGTPGKLHNFDFIDNEFRYSEIFKLHGGAYYVNAALSTQTAYIGGLVGFELRLDDLTLRGDYFGGHTNVSGATVTLNYYGLRNTNLYFGVGVPERDSGNEFYGVVGFQLSSGSLQ